MARRIGAFALYDKMRQSHPASDPAGEAVVVVLGGEPAVAATGPHLGEVVADEDLRIAAMDLLGDGHVKLVDALDGLEILEWNLQPSRSLCLALVDVMTFTLRDELLVVHPARLGGEAPLA